MLAGLGHRRRRRRRPDLHREHRRRGRRGGRPTCTCAPTARAGSAAPPLDARRRATDRRTLRSPTGRPGSSRRRATPGTEADVRRRLAERGPRRGGAAQAQPAADGLRRPAGAPARRAGRPEHRAGRAARGCGSRYRVVLVDEFQDTDPVQWEILERAFHGHRTLVLIGDPKQAIYAFRGADVVTYLLATARRRHAGDAGHQLAQRRAAGRRARRGDGRRRARRRRGSWSTRSTRPHTGGRLVGAPADAPLRLRVVDRGRLRLAPRRRRLAVEDARPLRRPRRRR